MNKTPTKPPRKAAAKRAPRAPLSPTENPVIEDVDFRQANHWAKLASEMKVGQSVVLNKTEAKALGKDNYKTKLVDLGHRRVLKTGPTVTTP